jgi:hypothetical protein
MGQSGSGGSGGAGSGVDAGPGSPSSYFTPLTNGGMGSSALSLPSLSSLSGAGADDADAASEDDDAYYCVVPVDDFSGETGIDEEEMGGLKQVQPRVTFCLFCYGLFVSYGAAGARDRRARALRQGEGRHPQEPRAWYRGWCTTEASDGRWKRRQCCTSN